MNLHSYRYLDENYLENKIDLESTGNQTVIFAHGGELFELTFREMQANVIVDINKQYEPFYLGLRVVLNSLILPLGEKYNFIIYSNIDDYLIPEKFGKTQHLYFVDIENIPMYNPSYELGELYVKDVISK